MDHQGSAFVLDSSSKIIISKATGRLSTSETSVSIMNYAKVSSGTSYDIVNLTAYAL